MQLRLLELGLGHQLLELGIQLLELGLQLLETCLQLHELGLQLLELGHRLLELGLQLLELGLQLFEPAVAPTFSSHGGVDRVIYIGEVCSVSGAETRYWTTDVGRG